MVDTMTIRRGEHRAPPTNAQKDEQVAGLCRAIDTICDAWIDADAARFARGFARQSPGPKAAAGEVRQDPADPLHARQMPAASSKPSAFGDQTGNAAMEPDVADEWVTDVRRMLGVLLIFAEGGCIGAFSPPRMRGALRTAARNMVELWPKNVAVLIERIHRLANTARVEWPATPKPGTPVGDIIVGGGRAETGATCAECTRWIVGNVVDPISRINGKPYHRQPCFDTAKRRADRQRATA